MTWHVDHVSLDRTVDPGTRTYGFETVDLYVERERTTGTLLGRGIFYTLTKAQTVIER